ncbi:MAG: glutamine synthetase, partial [Chloroflexota bacterium]|nr:glutamine synthetase [Chloroflexota bacterium]
MAYHLDPADVEAVLAKAERDQIKFVNLQFTDIAGHVKTVTEPVVQLADSLNYGTWFDGSSIEGFARIHESDMFLVPDPATYALVPWEHENGQVARFI